MNEIKKTVIKNKVLLVFTICVIAAVIIVLIIPAIQQSDTFGESQQPNAPTSAEDTPAREFFPQTADTTPQFVQIQADELKLRAAFGPEAIFPEYFRIVRGNMLLGYSEEEAADDAQTYLTGREAMYRYVTGIGFGVTKEDVALHIEKVLKELSQTDNFNEVLASYNDGQVDWEETVRSNYEYYRQTLAINQYLDANISTTVSELESQAMAQYKNTPHFEQLSKALDDMTMFMSKNKDNLVVAALNDESIASITYKEPLFKAVTANDDLTLAENPAAASERGFER